LEDSKHKYIQRAGAIAALGLAVAVVTAIARPLTADDENPKWRTRVATGAWITPLAAPGSAIYELHTDLRSDDNADAANAVSTALSPDGTTLRTIEDFLGMKHLGMNDANAEPMSDVFNTEADLTPYTPVLPGSLCQPPVSADLIPECKDASVLRTKAQPSLHSGAWWAAATRRFNFRRPDALDAAAFNRVLWRGIKGESTPYPSREASRQAEREDEGKMAKTVSDTARK
jgi:hypothetical protein